MAFIGLEEDYEEYKKENNVADKGETVEDGNTLYYLNMEPISDEDIKLLKQVRTKHDPYTVYMQNNVDFYDEFYFNDGEVDKEHEWVISEARQIRRICRDYSEYLYSCYVRDQYFEYLKEKYGDMFDIYWSNGLIKDWVPPVPIFVNSSNEDIESVLNGILEINDFDDEALIEYMEKYTDQDVIDNMGIRCEVETRRNVLMHMGEARDTCGIRTIGGTNSKIGSVSVNDLDELQTMFRGWYQEEHETDEEDTRTKFFKDTPSAIIEDYYSDDPLDSNGEFEEALEKGYFEASDDDEYNPNEMVIDSTSRIPMTRAEQRKRKFIRILEKGGWNPVQLMKNMNVGSSYEIRMLEEKARNHKLSKKKARSLMSDIMGEDISSFSTIDELNNSLFDD